MLTRHKVVWPCLEISSYHCFVLGQTAKLVMFWGRHFRFGIHTCMFYLFPRNLHTDLSNKKTAYFILFQLITNGEAVSVGATTEIGLKHSKKIF